MAHADLANRIANESAKQRLLPIAERSDTASHNAITRHRCPPDLSRTLREMPGP
jgi:hypothetical protein